MRLRALGGSPAPGLTRARTCWAANPGLALPRAHVLGEQGEVPTKPGNSVNEGRDGGGVHFRRGGAVRC